MKSKTLLFILSSIVACTQVRSAENRPGPVTIEERIATQERELTQLRAQVLSLQREIQELKETPEIKAVLEARNMLRILNASMEQFCLENDVRECQFSDLAKYIEPVRPAIRAEDGFAKLRLSVDEAEWRYTTESGIVVIFQRPSFEALLKQYKK
jgi:type II secretory pathway component PulM